MLREDGETESALGLHRALLARPRLAAGNRLAAELEFIRDLVELHRFSEALDRVETLDRHFDDPQIIDLRARALIGTGQMEAAAEVWLKGLRGAKPGTWRMRGTRFLAEVAREYLRLGQPETAERWAKQSLRIDSSTALAEVVLGDIDRGRDNGRAARKHYENALQEGGAQWVLPRLIDHSLAQGQIDRLIDVLEPARQDRPDDPALARAVLDLRLRRGDRDEYFALLESGDVPEIEDPAVWAGWTRHLLASEDIAGLNRLLSLLPAAFGPRSWRCKICGAEDHEPRAACLACGAPEPLAAHPVGETT